MIIVNRVQIQGRRGCAHIAQTLNARKLLIMLHLSKIILESINSVEVLRDCFNGL